jgi:amino acid permease
MTERVLSPRSLLLALLKTYCASGLLAFPFHVANAGWLVSLLVFPAAFFIAGLGTVDLVHCAADLRSMPQFHDQPPLSYLAIAEILLGHRGAAIAAFFSVLYQYTGLLAVASVLLEKLALVGTSEALNAAALIVALSALCCLRDLRALQGPVAAGNVSYFLGIGAVAVFIIFCAAQPVVEPFRKATGWKAGAKLVASSLYISEGVVIVPSLVQASSSPAAFLRVFLRFFPAVAAFILAFAFSACLAVGVSHIPPEISAVLPGAAGDAASGLISLSMLVSFPLMSRPCQTIIGEATAPAFSLSPLSRFVPHSPRALGNASAIAATVVVTLLASRPSLHYDAIVDISGAVCCPVLGIIIPALMRLRLLGAIPGAPSVSSSVAEYLTGVGRALSGVADRSPLLSTTSVPGTPTADPVAKGTVANQLIRLTIGVAVTVLMVCALDF